MKFRVFTRLQARGLKVLVERSVNRTELPQFSAYNPELGGELPLTNTVQQLTKAIWTN